MSVYNISLANMGQKFIWVRSYLVVWYLIEPKAGELQLEHRTEDCTGEGTGGGSGDDEGTAEWRSSC